MAVCANCGTSNIDGTKFCVTCGAQLGEAPAPESWRASSELPPPPPANMNAPDTTTGPAGGGATTGGGYTPQTPSSNYPTYTPTQGAQQYQPQGAGGAQPMHPAIPAIVSFLVPGIGLLFLPDKQKLAFMVLGGYVGLVILMTLLAFITLGLGACLFPLLILANVAAAIHTWDEAAKMSGGQFKPILFK